MIIEWRWDWITMRVDSTVGMIEMVLEMKAWADRPSQ
jgi:hypothetical protein